MTRLRVVLCLMCLLATARVASADHILDIGLETHEGLYFGGGDASGFELLDQTWYLDNVFHILPPITGDIQIKSGFLKSLTIGTSPTCQPTQFSTYGCQDGETLYEYETGELTINVTWETPTGYQSGKFVAPLLDFRVGVCEICDFMGARYGEAFTYLGPGHFDPALAAVFRVSPTTKGGFLQMYLDFITPLDPDVAVVEQQRASGFNGPHLAITVPEPASALLLAVGTFGVLRRRVSRTHR